ncbi:MAG: hypothetical protein J0L66_05370 [Cytophagales bacterium]|nr:hypothetical protein [Cytophagales bacterium]
MSSTKILLLLCAFTTMLMSCEHRVTMETTVHADGQLDKQIFLEVEKKQKKVKESFIHFVDSAHLADWQVIDSTQLPPYLKPKEGKKYVGYRKHFESAEAANEHLALPNDSLFRVTSSFKKKFRWFFTYIAYSDTYHAINRLSLSRKDFFTSEDFQFIERLPAEGKHISPADSLYLKLLNEKITDHYGNRAFFEEYFNLLLGEVRQLPDDAWQEKLKTGKESLYRKVVSDKNLPDNFLQLYADSLNIPVKLTNPQFVADQKRLENKINFITTAYDGKYRHTLHMPGPIVSTNADSVAGNSAYWAPPAIKFLLTNYEMKAESRKINYWAFAITLLVMGAAGWLLRKRE